MPVAETVALACSTVFFSCCRTGDICSRWWEAEFNFCVSFRSAFPVCQVAKNLHLPVFTMPVSSHSGGESLFFFPRKPGEQERPKHGRSFHFYPVIITWVWRLAQQNSKIVFSMFRSLIVLIYSGFWKMESVRNMRICFSSVSDLSSYPQNSAFVEKLNEPTSLHLTFKMKWHKGSRNPSSSDCEFIFSLQGLTWYQKFSTHSFSSHIFLATIEIIPWEENASVNKEERTIEKRKKKLQ